MTHTSSPCSAPPFAIDLFSTEAGVSLGESGRSVVAGVAPGCFHVDVPIEEYHQLPDSVSCSGLKHLLRSPAHFQEYLDGSYDGKVNLGSALHCLVLEEDVFDKTYTVYSGRRGTNAFKAFAEENPGKQILSEQEWISVLGMQRALIQYDEFPLWRALRSAKREMSVFWTDEETGVQCRVRFDALSAPYAQFDLKTTTDARPEAFLKQAIRLDYDLQAAMYTEAARHYTGEILPFFFAAVEEDRPHGVWLHEADSDMMDSGWNKFRHALQTYKQCRDTGKWPKYHNSVSRLRWPHYAQFRASTEI